jgi:hypothetical protein
MVHHYESIQYERQLIILNVVHPSDVSPAKKKKVKQNCGLKAAKFKLIADVV